MKNPRGLSLYQGPELDLTPDDSRTAVSALLRAAQLYPESSVVTVDETGRTRSVTYAELLEQARRLLTGLREHGLRPGDHLVLSGLPLAEFFPAFWACVLGGILPVAIAERCTEKSPALERLRHACELLEAPLVLTDRAGAQSLTGTDPALRLAVTTDCLRHEEADGFVEPSGEDVALLMLSSGSTGRPKAARLTHAGLAEFAASSRRILGVGPGDVSLNWLPVDHSGAFLLFHVLQVFTGSTNVHVPTERVLAEPLRWFDLLEEHRVNHTWAPAFGYALVADAIAARPGARWDLAPLRNLVCGGERIPLPVMRRFLAALAPSGVREEHIVPAWGMAETVTGITYGRLGAPGAVHRVLTSSLGGDLVAAGEDDPEEDCVTFVASGAPAHRATLRVVDERGATLPEGRIGRLQVRSARVTPGYANHPEATAEAFPDGPDWLDTGDLAFLADGQVTVTGRRKEVVILNGHNHYCHEIEDVAAEVPGVRTDGVAACGVPDAATGSESLALFFVSTGETGDERIIRDVRQALFRRLRLTAAYVVPVPEAEFPRTPAGKTRRGALRDRLVAGEFDLPAKTADEPAPLSGTDTARVVAESVATVLGRPVDPRTPFYELGMNSLLLMRTRGELERRLDRPVAPTALFEHPTVASLAAHLADTPAPDITTAEAAPAPGTADQRIAVVGMSARFPGADSVDAFWGNLRAGVDSIRVFTADDLAGAGLPAALLDDPGRVPVAGHLAGVDAFDAEFFGISRREAELTDPAHRLFLECCHQALEHGGYAATDPATRIGVFAGSGMHLYGHQGPSAPTTPPTGDPAAGIQAAVGRQPDFLASRVAYRLGLTGPAIGVQTACSTSLVAVHLAVQALLSGDADLALAGASAVHTPQEAGYRSPPGSILSPTGQCRAFDAGADGTVGGNGVAAVLLKRLDRALADGDTVHAVIIGSAVNNDGAGKVGYTAPGVAGQIDVVRQALRRAAVPAETVSYVEAHGTGTQLGDPVEFEALSRALGAETERTGFCALGSVKPNIGHLDSCAGMAGLIKTVLMLRHATIVPTLNLHRPHPELRLDESPFVLATELRPWRTEDGVPRRAGVSALGVGGTNAHIVLEEAPPLATRPSAERPVLVPVSAKDPEALDALVAHLAQHLRDHPDTDCADVARTTALGRPHREHRAAFVAGTSEELAAELKRWNRPPQQPLGPVAFAFAGQGSATPGMSRALHASAPAARRVLDQCEQLFRDEYDESLLDLLLADDGAGQPPVLPTRTAQPALFAHQMALYELWDTYGIRPSLLVGHSLGEYAALCAAGALSLADGLRLTARRGRLMQNTAPGGMLAVRCDRATALRIAQASGTEPAAANGPRSHVLSGSVEAIHKATGLLDREGTPWRALSVDRAFHSALMDPVLDELRECADRMAFSPLRIPLAGALDGVLRPEGWTVDSDYLCRQARETVRFDLALRTASQQGCADFLEIGTAGVLAGLGRQCVPGSRWVHQGPGSESTSGLLGALGELYSRGADVNWPEVVQGGGRVPLPGHPLRRTRTALPASAVPVPAVPVPAHAEVNTAMVPTETNPGVMAPVPSPTPVDPSAVFLDEDRVEQVMHSVVRLTGAQLGAEPDEVGPDASFLALGADSLSLMGMTRELETLYRVRIPVRELFSAADTPRRLAELVVREGGVLGETTPAPRAGSAATAPTPPTPPTDPASGTERRTDAGATAPGPVDGPPDASGPTNDRRGDGHPPAQGPAQPVAPAGDGVQAVVEQQLRLAERMVDQVTGLMVRQLEALGGPGPAPADVPPAAPATESTTATSPAPATALTTASMPTAPATSTVPDTTHTPTTANMPVSSAGPRPSDRTAPERPATALPPCADVDAPGSGCDFSLYFFGDYPETGETGRYDLIMSAAEFADRHGFHTLWFPERHFNSFGSLFPNPSVLAAALAARTSRIRLHAGSVVLPLHHPVRVAEEWSVVDNLSGGRAGMCVAGGWHAADFALAPGNFGHHRELMYEQLDTVRRLWSGESVPMTAGNGDPVDIRLHPSPVQPQPPLFVAVVGNPESYRRAAAGGLGVVTNLMAQSVEQLAENIVLYRRTRAEHGLDPAAGRVVVLVHTYLGDDAERARAEAYRPFIGYLRSSLSLFDQVTNSLGFEVDLDNTPEEDVEFLLGRAYERYCESRALIGDEHSASETVRRLTAAGADEIACFVDFGVPPERVLAALPAIDRLRRGHAEPQPRRLPLSAAQRRIWVLEKLHPGTAMYHEPKAIRLEGPLDQAAFTWALHRVIARQPALRTVFHDDDGVPYRLVLDEMRVDCPVEDHTGTSEEEALRSVLGSAEQDLFDLGTGPLFSTRLLRLAADVHLLVLRAHHIVFDSSSTTVFTRDLAAHYRARQSGTDTPPPLSARTDSPPDPADVARDLDFWQRELAGAPVLQLPHDRPRPAVRTGAGAGLTHELAPELVAELRRFGAGHGATLFMTVLAAIGATLGRFSGQDDIVIGTAVAGRPLDAQDEIGLFLDTLALRLDLSGDPGFVPLVHRVRESTTTAYEHRSVPFDELVGALGVPRDPSRNPLFQVLVEYENEGEAEFDPPRVDARLLDVPGARAPFDLSIYLTHHRDGLRFMAEYDTALFDESTVRRLVDYVETVLSRALDTPTAPLSALTALTPADRSLLDRHEGDTAPAPGRTLHELFEEQARRTPDAPALISDGLELGYRQLDERADRLARQLRAGGAARGVLVAVLLPRGPELITALLAVLKSGAAYLPLDPGAPAARTALLLHDGAPALLLTTGGLLSGMRLPDGLPVHLVDEAPRAADTVAAPAAAAEDTGTSVPKSSAGPEDPAYCIYTSGSTGRPKGVVVPHRGPANLVCRHLERHRPLRTLQWTSPSFDVSVQEVFTTLAAGAPLVLIGNETRLDPSELAAAVRRHGVERLFMPVTPLKYLMETDPRMPSLRELFVAGEALDLTPPLRRFLERHPDCALHNQYGPTEASVIVTSHRVEPERGDRPPIGRPVGGVRIRLLDGDGNAVPVGAVGEIHVGGAAVAHGYHDRPDETAAAFLPDARDGMLYRTGDLGRWRSDGELEYLGRVDDQVKIRGFRVEPAEVQAALAVRDDVTAAAVVPRRDTNGETVLAAYVVPAPAADGIGHLAAALAAELPDHLVPRQWVRMDRLPVNTSGKLDRDRLPEPAPAPSGLPAGEHPTGPADEPSTPAEKVLHEIWCSELGAAAVPVTRSFFELGGHSLMAVRLLNRTAREHGFEMSMADFFRTPTIRAVAERMASEAASADVAEAASETVSGTASGPAEVVDRAPMPSTVRRMWRRHHERSDPSVYNVAHRIDLHGDLDVPALSHALEELVGRHAALRSRAVHHDGEYLIEVLGDLPVPLPVTDLARTAPDEADVDVWCREQARRPFSLDTAPLFRFELAATGRDRWVLVAVLSHAICDGWSIGVLWRELEELYNARRSGRAPALEAVPAQVTDYARWEREQLTGERREELMRFWRRELDGARLRLDLPYDRPRPEVLSGEGALHRLTVGRAVTGRVTEVAARLGTTPYLILAAAFAAWAGGRCGGGSDVVLAASSANRTRQEFENVVGFIGDPVLLRARTSASRTFADLVTHLGAALFPAIDHQALPLEEVVRLAAPELAGRLFPTVLFTVVTTAPPSMDLDWVRTRIGSLPVGGLARNELYVVLVPGDDGIEVFLEYSTDLFDASTIASWGEEFAALLAEVASDPEVVLPGRDG